MPVFRIHRMKEAPRESFRWAPHVSGMATVKPKDYEAAAEIDAESEYAAWGLLRGAGQPLHVGDLLEAPSGELRICKYVGFEEARWLLPDVKLPDGMPQALAGMHHVPPASPASPNLAQV